MEKKKDIKREGDSMVEAIFCGMVILLIGMLVVLFLGLMEWIIKIADKHLYEKYPRLFADLHPDIQKQKEADRKYGRKAG